MKKFIESSKGYNKCVHVISRGNKWAVYKEYNKRASKICNYREQAYFYAREISNKVVVHNKDGTILFSDNL